MRKVAKRRRCGASRSKRANSFPSVVSMFRNICRVETQNYTKRSETTQLKSENANEMRNYGILESF